MPFDIAMGYVRAWLAKDLEWDCRNLTFEDFEALFDRSVSEMSAAAIDDPNLAAFHVTGGKLLLSHGAADPLIPYMGTVDYYRRVLDAMGSETDTHAFIRLFLSEGDGHGISREMGAGLTIADAMAALMLWVERDEAPEEIVGRSIEFTSGVQRSTRPVYAYPMVPEYRGFGDATDAASFQPVHFSKRAEAAARD